MLQSSVMAICDALSPRARAAAMIGGDVRKQAAASVTPEASQACCRAVAERRRGIAKAWQRRIRAVMLAICDALSPEARAAAMIGE